MKGYIYTLHKQNENDVFYVGCTVNPEQRILAHRCNYPFWKYDCRIGLSIVEEIDFTDRKDLYKLESYWIQQFVAWGFNLVNYNLHFGRDVRLYTILYCE